VSDQIIFLSGRTSCTEPHAADFVCSECMPMAAAWRKAFDRVFTDNTDAILPPASASLSFGDLPPVDSPPIEEECE